MDVVTLGPKGDTNYVVDVLVEGYNSMIWHERYQEPGEFELKTPYILKTRDLLPRGTLISHLETREVMMVEDHAIGIDSEGRPELTVTGRSLDFFSENRYVNTKYQKKRKMAQQYRPLGAALVLLWQAFDNSSGKDVTRAGDWNWNTLDAIPNVAIADGTFSPVGAVKNRWLSEGLVYPQLLSFLVRGDLGVRMVRPPSKNKQIVTIDTTTDGKGNISRNTVATTNQLIFEVYQGVNRSETQTDNEKVVFEFDQGDIDNAQYLWSIKEYKTACELMSSINIDDVFRRDNEADFTGLDRRVMTYDAGTPEYPDEPAKPEPPKPIKTTATQTEKDQYDKDIDDYNKAVDDWTPKHDVWLLQKQQIDSDFRDDASEDALKELKKTRMKTVFSGDISPFSKYKYKQDYDLGDTVTLNGNYGQQDDMVVSEYVRTEDAEGDRGYPGLIVP